MGHIGFPELIIVFLIVVVLFGATRLPQLGRGLGEGISNFKRGLKGGEEREIASTSESKKEAEAATRAE
jgi:sec-independent protein translocase protein TatA